MFTDARSCALAVLILVGLLSTPAVTAQAEVIGAPLVNRGNVDGAVGYLFLHDNGTPGFTTTGIVESWSFYNDNGAAQGGRTIEPVILKQSGANWIVTGTGVPVTTPANLAGVQTYSFTLASGSPVVGPGYTFAHHDLTTGGTIEYDSTPGTGTQRFQFVGTAAQIVGTTLSGLSNRDRTYSVQFNSSNKLMVTVGNPLVLGIKDGAVGGVFVDLDPLTTSARVLEWAFFDNQNATPDRQITPLLLEKVGTDFFIRGIGTTRTTTELGEQHYLFDLVSGSDLAGPNVYFAWRDGTPTLGGGSVINYNDAPGSTGIRYFGSPATVGLGGNLGGGTFYARDYSFQVTLLIPEPGSVLLLGIGALLLPLPTWRRRKSRPPLRTGGNVF